MTTLYPKGVEEGSCDSGTPGLPRHFRRASERPFTKVERGRVTCLFGGMTSCHDRLMEAAFCGMGYKASRIPTPTKADFRCGREYCSPGLCNPAYFTIGALVNYLKRLRDEEGRSLQSILDGYVLVIPGSRGPCRFGAYEAEYRLALLNSGFDGFRVVVIQQKAGLGQEEDGAGVEASLEFARRWITALMVGDLFCDLLHQIRPYEVVPGAAEKAIDRAVEYVCAEFMHPGNPWRDTFRQLLGPGLGKTLSKCRRIIEQIEVDYTHPRPVCKVTGEFWAQTTDGDGNCHLFSFIEEHGGEVVVEPVTSWVIYLLDSAVTNRRLRRPIARYKGLVHRFRARVVNTKEEMLLRFVSFLVRREYGRMCSALGGLPHALPDMAELRMVARPFYNDRITGGEGHMEVGHTISCAANGKAHMVVSVKPFGCLPSTQSDGVQGAALTQQARLGHHILFLSVETAGEAEVGVHSRVLMVLEEAMAWSRREFEASLARAGCSAEEFRSSCESKEGFRKPVSLEMYRHPGVVGRAANLVYAIALQKTPGCVQDMSVACPDMPGGGSGSRRRDREMEKAKV